MHDLLNIVKGVCKHFSAFAIIVSHEFSFFSFFQFYASDLCSSSHKKYPPHVHKPVSCEAEAHKEGIPRNLKKK